MFITNHQGKAAGHGWVFCEAERLLFDGTPGQADKLIVHLDRFVISERVEFKDRSAEWMDLLLVGPQAEVILRQLGIEPPAERLQQLSVRIADGPVLLRRVDLLTAAPCFLLSLSREQEALELVHQARGDRSLALCPYLRLEERLQLRDR